MNNEFKGFSKVFYFTLKEHFKNKSYLMTTIIIGCLCLLLPAIIMVSMDTFKKDKSEDDYKATNIHKINVVDKTPGQAVDYSILNTVGDENFSSLTYKSFDNLEAAAKEAEDSEDTLLLLVEPGEGVNEVNVLLPDNSKLENEDAYAFQDFIGSYYQLILVKKSGLSNEQLAELSIPIEAQAISKDASAPVEGPADGTEEQELDEVKDMFSVILPYATIMVLYFMILNYGQGVANSVIMEKSNKLIDTFLITVKPGALMLGKTLAISLTGVMQLFIWIISLVASFAAGTALVKAMNPSTELGLIKLFEVFGSFSGMFSIGGVILSVLIILSGFLMYCALAAMGGAIASKPEDLSTTNMLFTMALLISFFGCMYGGIMDGSLTANSWQVYVPFSAMMAVPGMALLGNLPIINSVISLAIILVTTLFITYIAGKVYKMLIFHRGNSIPISKAFAMLRKRK